MYAGDRFPHLLGALEQAKNARGRPDVYSYCVGLSASLLDFALDGGDSRLLRVRVWWERGTRRREWVRGAFSGDHDCR